MTKKKDLKRRVRERAAKTGESYLAARKQVVKAPEVEEPPKPAGSALKDFLDQWRGLVSATPPEILRGDYLGFKCAVRPSLWLVRDGLAKAALDGFKAALEALRGEPAAVILRRSVLEGGPLPVIDLWRGSAEDDPLLIGMLARIKAGIIGLGPDGRSLAFLVGERVVIARCYERFTAQPTIMLHTKEEYATVLRRLG